MIKERYVNLEVAKLLRNKGFDEECPKLCTINNSLIFEGYKMRNSELSSELVTIPTQAVACDWIEETFNISIMVYVGIIGYRIEILYALKDPNIASNDVNQKDDMSCGDNSDGSWSDKECAYNTALKYVLTNLV